MRLSFKGIVVGLILLVSHLLDASAQDPYMIVLGVAQDGGYPHLACSKDCCTAAWKDPGLKRMVVSLALVDPVSEKWYLFEATPDMTDQIQYFRELTGGMYNYLPDAIFVSHAHIGHYTGLTELGREAMNSNDVPVYALPRMSTFLRENGPWSQLVNLNNISIVEIKPGSSIDLSANISVSSFEVPHRDEFSETAGYRIATSGNNYLFIPDIDKWGKWDRNIEEEISSVDIAFIDGTFYSASELPGRDMSEIPHPFIVETIDLFIDKPADIKKRITFIHLNHSNPALSNPDLISKINKSGFRIAVQGKNY
jgi:pyrroloquinoline quinone biosynthesis protein B